VDEGITINKGLMAKILVKSLNNTATNKKELQPTKGSPKGTRIG